MLNILLITDNKPGHESISRGLKKHFEKKHEVITEEIVSNVRIKIFIKIGTYILNNIKLNNFIIKTMIKLIYKNININTICKPNLIISTGGSTSLLNILFSKYFLVPNLYCSSLRGLNSELFTNVVSIIDKKLNNQILVDVVPVNITKLDKKLKGNFLTVLIGGSTKNYKFKTDEYIAILEKLILLAKKTNYKIMFSTSRRTPIEVENSLKRIIENNKSVFDKSVFYNEKPEKILKNYFINSDIIFVTEDSGSMITESVLSHKKVYTISSLDKNLDKTFRIFIDNLENKKFIKSINVNDILDIDLKEKFKFIDYEPAEKVYNEIMKVVNE